MNVLLTVACGLSLASQPVRPLQHLSQPNQLMVAPPAASCQVVTIHNQLNCKTVILGSFPDNTTWIETLNGGKHEANPPVQSPPPRR
jgi:hypothetical protein